MEKSEDRGTKGSRRGSRSGSRRGRRGSGRGRRGRKRKGKRIDDEHLEENGAQDERN